jgi:endogenous inhibitor of DNA gyrase (YacG/DUF329 family)
MTMDAEMLPLCPHCGVPLSSEAQHAYGYCSPKCRDKHTQEMQNKKNVEYECGVLMRQYEQQKAVGRWRKKRRKR